MTCIVGLGHEGKVCMGADCAGGSDWETRSVTTPKVFMRGPFLIGYTTSFRMGQVLQCKLEAREQLEGETDYEFMVAGFGEAVRNTLKSIGFSRVENNQESGGQFLVGYRGELYEMESDFAILQFVDRFSAVGVGAPYALGAMAALDGLAPRERVMRSLEIAALFCNGVSGPFVLKEV